MTTIGVSGWPSRTMREERARVLAEQRGGERDAASSSSCRARSRSRRRRAWRSARPTRSRRAPSPRTRGSRRRARSRARRPPATRRPVPTRSSPPRSSRRTRASAVARARARSRRRSPAIERTIGCMPSGRYTTARCVGIGAAERRAGRVPSPRTAGCSSTCFAAAHDRERRARARAAIAEVVGAGRVVELDRLGVADELEAHADREPRGADGVARQPVEIGRDRRVGTGTRRCPATRSRGRTAPPDAVGHRSAIGYGNLAPTPPSTVSV